jgi:hypothetical protein
MEPRTSPALVRASQVEPEVRQALEAAGFLTFEGLDTWHACPECAEGSCPVVALGEQDGATIYQVVCGHGEMRLLPEEDLYRWQATASGIATALARLFGLPQGITTVLPKRLWALGESLFAGVPVTWFLGVGTTCADARTTFRGQHALQAAPHAVVLTPTLTPPDDLFDPHVVTWPFAQLLRVVQGEVRFNPDAMQVLARKVVAHNTHPSGVAPKTRKRLDVPPGTRWDQIIITFENTDAITIQAPGSPHGESFSYDDLGFWDDRTSNPAADDFRHNAYWRRFLRFAYLYLPSEQVSKAAWASDEMDQVDQVKTWAYRINQRLNAVIPDMATDMLPIAGKRGVYTANFRVVHGAVFKAEMQRGRG